MRKMLQNLWQDEAGIAPLEYMLVATIVGLGLVVGLSRLEIALDAELTELGNAIVVLDQATVHGKTGSTPIHAEARRD